MKVPREPFQVVDAATGKPLPEILVIPRYSSWMGMGIVPEGPARGIVRNYLDGPFVYRTGEPFILKKQPKAFPSVPLLFVFVGKVRDIDGILVIAPGYRPLWTEDLWWYPRYPGYERKLQLTPISGNEWLLVLEKQLSTFVKGASRVNENCRIWNLPEKCTLKIDYDKNERELVRSFLQQARNQTK